MSDVTRILSQIDAGDSAAAEKLLPLVYDELRKLAAAKLAHEQPGQTLQATALVHEAYLRLVGGAGDRSADLVPAALAPSPQPIAPSFSSRGHFFAAAAQAMRRILVDRARQKKAAKHGGEFARIEFEADLAAAPEVQEDLVALDEALNRFAAEYPQQAALVQLRYFGGLTLPEAAAALELSERTAGRQWAFARAWLRRAVEGTEEKP
jgi:RNA polymerase sigma factor (sigma-70 family)